MLKHQLEQPICMHDVGSEFLEREFFLSGNCENTNIQVRGNNNDNPDYPYP